jgi:hypothetical protein
VPTIFQSTWMSPVVVLAVCLVPLSISGCSREPVAAGAGAPAPGAVQSAATPAAVPPRPAPADTVRTPVADAAPAVLARQPFNSDPDLTCEVLEVRRVSGGAVLLKWRLVRASATSGSAVAGEKGIWHNWSWADVYFTDPAENKKYSGLKDTAGSWLAQGPFGGHSYKPGGQQAMWMKFPAPPETSTKVTFIFPGFPPFEDVPVGP